MRPYAFGVDIGGTAIKLGLFTTDGELIEKMIDATDFFASGIHYVMLYLLCY